MNRFKVLSLVVGFAFVLAAGAAAQTLADETAPDDPAPIPPGFFCDHPCCTAQIMIWPPPPCDCACGCHPMQPPVDPWLDPGLLIPPSEEEEAAGSFEATLVSEAGEDGLIDPLPDLPGEFDPENPQAPLEPGFWPGQTYVDPDGNVWEWNGWFWEFKGWVPVPLPAYPAFPQLEVVGM